VISWRMIKYILAMIALIQCGVVCAARQYLLDLQGEGVPCRIVQRVDEYVGGATMQVCPKLKDGKLGSEQEILMVSKRAIQVGTSLVMDELAQTLGKNITLLFPARGALSMFKCAQKAWPDHIDNMHVIVLATMDGMESAKTYTLSWERERIDFTKPICVMDEILDTGGSSAIILQHCLKQNSSAQVHFRSLFGGLGRRQRVGDTLYVPLGTEVDSCEKVVRHQLSFRLRIVQRCGGDNQSVYEHSDLAAIKSANVQFLYNGWVSFPCEQENLLYPVFLDIPADLAGQPLDVLICAEDPEFNLGVVCSNQMDSSCGYILMLGSFEEDRFLEKGCDTSRSLVYASDFDSLLSEEQVRLIAERRGYKAYRLVSLKCVDKASPADLARLHTPMKLQPNTMHLTQIQTGIYPSALSLLKCCDD